MINNQTLGLGIMRQVATLAFVIFFIGPSFGQIKIERPAKELLPKNISIPGKVISIQKWDDLNGANYFILSGTDEFKSPKGLSKDYRDKEIYMRHFIVSGQKSKMIWGTSDAVRECPVDIELSFLEENPRVTDLDKDGVSEVWIIYHNGCHGDVSPTRMTILMNANDRQSTLTCNRIADIGLNRKIGGEIISNMFKQMALPFKSYSDSLWNKHKRWN